MIPRKENTWNIWLYIYTKLKCVITPVRWDGLESGAGLDVKMDGRQQLRTEWEERIVTDAQILRTQRLGCRGWGIWTYKAKGKAEEN
jgi:hypothetical protein